MFLHYSHLENVFIFIVVVVFVSFFFTELYVSGMRQRSSIYAMKSFQNEAHILSWTVRQSSNRCSWHRKFVSWTMAWRRRRHFLWMRERAKTNDLYLGVNLKRLMYLVRFLYTYAYIEIWSYRSSCCRARWHRCTLQNKSIRWEFGGPFIYVQCPHCSHTLTQQPSVVRCPYFISDRVAEVDSV